MVFEIFTDEFKENILTKAGLIIEARAKELVPKDTGMLMGDIRPTEVNVKQMKVKVGTGIDYGYKMEFGAKPHTPDSKKIEKWAKRHGIPAWVVMQSIKKKGIKVGTVKTPLKTPSGYRPFLRPALHQSITRVNEMIAKEIRTEISKHRKT